MALKQATSSTADGGYAKTFGGNSAEIVKSSGDIGVASLDQFEIVYGGDLSASAVKGMVEKFDPDFPVYAVKIGSKFHLIEGKSALKAAEALKEPAVKVKYIDATIKVEQAKAVAAYQKMQAEAAAKAAQEKAIADAGVAAAAAKLAKSVKPKKTAKKVKLTDQEIMTIKHEVAQAKSGHVFYKLKTDDHEYFSWAGRHYNDISTVEKAAIDNYKGNGYININGALRRVKGDRAAVAAHGGAIADRVRTMDRAMMKNEMPVDVQAFRGFDIRHAYGLPESVGSPTAGRRRAWSGWSFTTPAICPSPCASGRPATSPAASALTRRAASGLLS